MVKGTIKALTDKGFGFINTGTGGDLFFHKSALEGISYNELQEGQAVECETEDGPRGLRATTVRIVGELLRPPTEEELEQAQQELQRIAATPEQRRSWAFAETTGEKDNFDIHRNALRDVIVELEKQASWNGKDHPDTRAAYRKLIRIPFGTESLADLCTTNGVQFTEDLDDYLKLVKKLSKDDQSLLQARTDLESKYPDKNHVIEDKIKNEMTFRNRPWSRKKESSVRVSSLDHRIQELTPTAKWHLFIDETGKSFFRDSYAEGSHSVDQSGRFVGVLLPDPIPLDPLPKGIHFKEIDDDKRDNIIQHLIDAPVGIFGVSVNDLPETRGDRWVDGVMYIVEWVLRLLPTTGGTEIDVMIEERGNHTAGSNWESNKQLTLMKLVQSNETRFNKFDVSLEVVSKDASPYLAYADAVAHTWGGTAPLTKSRLKKSGLTGTCLHSGRGEDLQQAWEFFSQGTELAAQKWQAILTDPDRRIPMGLAATGLDQLSQSCRQDPKLWQRYFEATQHHLESKAIDLKQLGKEVQWLTLCKPEKAEIPPLLELAWLTAELEATNHNGCIDEDTVSRLETLGESLYEEAPSLVCQADLDRAVLATNQFQFDEATRALDRWKDKEMAVAGRKHWGRAQSSFGQHAAFNGDFDKAEEYFAQAIEAFEGLADEGEASGEKDQTATYRAIAAMDCPETDPEIIRRHVGSVVSLALDEIRSIATTVDRKYAHHMLLRYLVQHGTTEECSAYLSVQESWLSDQEGHPWQLIEAYRGILLHPTAPKEAVSHMLNGYALAEGEGPTVRLIGLTLGVIAMGWGAEEIVKEQDLNDIRIQLPAASDRIAHLQQALKTPLDPPKSLLAQVLPFNFR